MLLRSLCGGLAALLLLSLAHCSGGGSSSSGDSAGWVRITQPTESDSYTTGCSSIVLGGDAFVSPGWHHCCPADCAVEVTWHNSGTGADGRATSNCAVALGLWRHTWTDTPSLAAGVNVIDVTAVDPSGLKGTDRISVTHDPQLGCP